MNQKDYKEIARIHRKHLDLLMHCVMFTDADKQIIKNQFRIMAIEKADYFEREDNKQATNLCKGFGHYIDFKKFNRQQFLKECGVEK